MKIPEGCTFYQTIELPGVGVIQGSWDHREATDVYLGNVDFNQKSVLDVGPANGYFSFEMEKRGAQVTAIDLGENSPWDVVPHPYLDEESHILNMQRNVRMVEKAFWFSHQVLRSKVELVYGSVYDVPKVIKEVDIALMSNVLQHFRDPFLAIQRVASVVKETMVITEALWLEDPAFYSSNSMVLIPRAESPEANHSWWHVSPSIVIELLKLLGFLEIQNENHYQEFIRTSADGNSRKVKHFTLTARRPQPLESRELAKLPMAYSSDFYEAEVSKKHIWRWSPGPHSQILISNMELQDKVVSLSFGLYSIMPEATLKVVVNGQLSWESGSFYDVKPVYIAAVRLVPGGNTVEITSTGQPAGSTTTDDKRILSYAVYDFTICRSHNQNRVVRPPQSHYKSLIARLKQA